MLHQAHSGLEELSGVQQAPKMHGSEPVVYTAFVRLPSSCPFALQVVQLKGMQGAGHHFRRRHLS